MLEKPVT